MLPTSVRKSIRFSDARLYTENVTELPPNDDEEERRLARRRTLLRQILMDENQNLEKCLEIYKDNKISRDNAWSLSVIDTLTVLLERHQNFLNNFRVACPSLEASSRVYGLRVDSIYGDVMRISAGLAAKKFSSKNAEVDGIDDVDDSNDRTDIANKSVAEAQPDTNANPPKPKKRARRQISTITKNKDTLNGLLETVPMDDVIFGKLNRVGGSINSSKRLMNNVLPTNDYDLKLCTKFSYWTGIENDNTDYTSEIEGNYAQDDVPANVFGEIEKEETDLKNSDVDKFDEIREEGGENEGEILHKCSKNLFIRSLHTGYIISKKNKIKYDDEKENTSPLNVNDPDDTPRVLTPSELAVQFDMDAECQPVCLDPEAPMLDVDFCEYDDLTSEEVTAINRCRGLRHSAQIMEDLRPTDSSSQLEYSYRPLNKISRFWAGPSHWKFKGLRPSQSTLLFSSNTQNGRLINQRAQRAQVVKTRSKPLIFGVDGDESLYLPYDKATNKQRRANIHKKWDQRKLKLPTDLLVNKNTFMRGWLVPRGYDIQNSNLRKTVANKSAGTIANSVVQPDDDEHCADNDVFIDHLDMLSDTEHLQRDDVGVDSESQECNDTVLEIATEFDGAPSQVSIALYKNNLTN
ncbi:condensin complex subunit 2-like [Teleopsis dalmanni]|uniref:condensin complex subunit 2-like n=1 Tax=Teleopsis dalmanni TaxID=139649 RepID=UPI0018CF25A6|nr:condensin complex subunit 2-like [Teleopsis dalmanni]